MQKPAPEDSCRLPNVFILLALRNAKNNYLPLPKYVLAAVLGTGLAPPTAITMFVHITTCLGAEFPNWWVLVALFARSWTAQLICCVVVGRLGCSVRNRLPWKGLPENGSWACVVCQINDYSQSAGERSRPLRRTFVFPTPPPCRAISRHSTNFPSHLTQAFLF